jgi:DNA-directed RNA polymerase specialized sigma24 family protein
MSPESSNLHLHLAAEAAARRSYGKLVALLALQTRDVSAAEDALAEAFASALEHWPRTGCPANPEGWLLTAARREVIDALRRQRSAELATFDLRVVGQFEIAYCSPIASPTPASSFIGTTWPPGPAGHEHPQQQPSLPQPAPSTPTQAAARTSASQDKFFMPTC